MNLLISFQNCSQRFFRFVTKSHYICLCLSKDSVILRSCGDKSQTFFFPKISYKIILSISTNCIFFVQWNRLLSMNKNYTIYVFVAHFVYSIRASIYINLPHRWKRYRRSPFMGKLASTNSFCNRTIQFLQCCIPLQSKNTTYPIEFIWKVQLLKCMCDVMT